MLYLAIKDLYKEAEGKEQEYWCDVVKGCILMAQIDNSDTYDNYLINIKKLFDVCEIEAHRLVKLTKQCIKINK